MRTYYDPNLKAHLTVNEQGKVKQILHTQEYFVSEEKTASLAVAQYLNKMAPILAILPQQIQNLQQKTSFLDPREQDIQYRLYEVKKMFSSTTYAYYQTIHNVPVWEGGISVTVKENPYRITHADNTSHDDLKLVLPPQKEIETIREKLIKINSLPKNGQPAPAEGEEAGKSASTSLVNALLIGTKGAKTEAAAAATSWLNRIKVKRGLFYIFRYEANKRQPVSAQPILIGERKEGIVSESGDQAITLPLPPVPEQIKDGQHYLVVELVFNVLGLTMDKLNWKALVEVQTGAILWLRAMISGVNGLLFLYDPITKTGDTTITASSSDAVLDPLRDDVLLPNLDAPVSGIEHLSGSNVTVVDDDIPNIAVPTQPAGSDFDYHARSNEFGAVNAYYHQDNIFNVIESLGFNLATYFDGTIFPVHVDHRGHFQRADGLEINAACYGDAGGGSGDGIGMVVFCLSDLSDTIHPLGRAVDKWVHWHETCGHGILYDHVNGPNFGFAHSAGDSFAAFQNDPASALRTDPTMRFRYAPFRAGLDRWFNRDVASGWGWGGTQDLGMTDGYGYLSEQILATTLFRFYRGIGGDSVYEDTRWYASRVATYLVLNAVGRLSPANNPQTPDAFYNFLIAADADDWTSEGYAGGAYNKVLRWAFEKQGLFRAPGASTTNIGLPPEVDLYIDDGRGGEYTYQEVHWENPSVWNRQNADGMTTHQQANPGASNYAYVKVKNRGTNNASGTVKVYHCKPGAGLTWPVDFEQATPIDGLSTGNLLANSGNEVIVGPFTWTPNVNMYGHDCLLAIVTADGDSSNIDKLGPGETIQEFRLVPNDNNVGQRNVAFAAGGGGGEAFKAGIDGAIFFAGNNFNKVADYELRVKMPKVLHAKGWRLGFVDISDNKFKLKPGEKRKIELKLSPGKEFTADEIRKEENLNITVYLIGNGMLVGGMSYRVDPDIKELPLKKPGAPKDCTKPAQALLDCLNLTGNQKVKKVYATKISVDIELNRDCDCDC